MKQNFNFAGGVADITILIIISVIVVVLLFYSIFLITNEKFTEYFGSSCVDLLVPFVRTPYYDTRPGTIFISIASYRDSECSDTIDSIFNNAKYPENIYLGICEQNNISFPDERCYILNVPLSPINSDTINIKEKYKDHIRYHNMDYTKAS